MLREVTTFFACQLVAEGRPPVKPKVLVVHSEPKRLDELVAALTANPSWETKGWSEVVQEDSTVYQTLNGRHRDDSDWDDEYTEHLHKVEDVSFIVLHQGNSWASRFVEKRLADKVVLFTSGGTKAPEWVRREVESNPESRRFVSDSRLLLRIRPFIDQCIPGVGFVPWHVFDRLESQILADGLLPLDVLIQCAIANGELPDRACAAGSVARLVDLLGGRPSLAHFIRTCFDLDSHVPGLPTELKRILFSADSGAGALMKVACWMAGVGWDGIVFSETSPLGPEVFAKAHAEYVELAKALSDANTADSRRV